MFSDGSADAWDLLWAIPDEIVVDPPSIPEKTAIARRVAPSFVSEHNHNELPSDCAVTEGRTSETNTICENGSCSTSFATITALTEATSLPHAASGAPVLPEPGPDVPFPAAISPEGSDCEPECAVGSSQPKLPGAINSAPGNSTRSDCPSHPSPNNTTVTTSAPAAPLSDLGSQMPPFSAESPGTQGDGATTEAFSGKVVAGSRCCSTNLADDGVNAAATGSDARISTASTPAEQPVALLNVATNLLQGQCPPASAPPAPLVGAPEAPASESGSASETDTVAATVPTAAITSVKDLSPLDAGCSAAPPAPPAAAAANPGAAWWSAEALRGLHRSRDPRRQQRRMAQGAGQEEQRTVDGRLDEHQGWGLDVPPPVECSGEALVEPHAFEAAAGETAAPAGVGPYVDPMRRRSHTLGGPRPTQEQLHEFRNQAPPPPPYAVRTAGPVGAFGGDEERRDCDADYGAPGPNDGVQPGAKPTPPQSAAPNEAPRPGEGPQPVAASVPPKSAPASAPVAAPAAAGAAQPPPPSSSYMLPPLRRGPTTTSSRLLARLRPAAAAAAAAPAVRHRGLKGSAAAAAAAKAMPPRGRAEAWLSGQPAVARGASSGGGDADGDGIAEGPGLYGVYDDGTASPPAEDRGDEPDSILDRIQRALEAAEGVAAGGGGGRVKPAVRRAGGASVGSGRIIADGAVQSRLPVLLPPPRARFDFRVRKRRAEAATGKGKRPAEGGAAFAGGAEGADLDLRQDPAPSLGYGFGAASGRPPQPPAAFLSPLKRDGAIGAAAAAAASGKGQKRKAAAFGALNAAAAGHGHGHGGSLEEALEEWRAHRARSVRKTPEAFLRRGLLEDLAAKCPTSVLCLEAVPGLARPWVRKFGQEVLDLCRNFMHLQLARAEAAAAAACARRAAATAARMEAAATAALRGSREEGGSGCVAGTEGALPRGHDDGRRVRDGLAEEQQQPRLGREGTAAKGTAAAVAQSLTPGAVGSAQPQQEGILSPTAAVTRPLQQQQQQQQQPEPRGAAEAGAAPPPAVAAAGSGGLGQAQAGRPGGLGGSWRGSWGLGRGAAALDPRARMRQQLLGLLGLEDGPSLAQQLLNGEGDDAAGSGSGHGHGPRHGLCSGLCSGQCAGRGSGPCWSPHRRRCRNAASRTAAREPRNGGPEPAEVLAAREQQPAPPAPSPQQPPRPVQQGPLPLQHAPGATGGHDGAPASGIIHPDPGVKSLVPAAAAAGSAAGGGEAAAVLSADVGFASGLAAQGGTGLQVAAPAPVVTVLPTTKARIVARRLARAAGGAAAATAATAPHEPPLQHHLGPTDPVDAGAPAVPPTAPATAGTAAAAAAPWPLGAEPSGAAAVAGSAPGEAAAAAAVAAQARSGDKRPYHRKRHHRRHRESGQEAAAEGGRRVARRSTNSNSPRAAKARARQAAAGAGSESDSDDEAPPEVSRRRGRPSRVAMAAAVAAAAAAAAAAVGNSSGWVPPPAGCRVRCASQLAYATTPALHHVRTHDLLGMLAEAGRTAAPFLEEGATREGQEGAAGAGAGAGAAHDHDCTAAVARDGASAVQTNPSQPAVDPDGPAAGEPSVVVPAAAVAAAVAFQKLGRSAGQAHMRRLRALAEAALPAWEVRRVLACRVLGPAAQAEAVLRLPTGASRDEVRVAFRRLSLLVHPDKNRSCGAAEAFALVSAAANRLLGKGT